MANFIDDDVDSVSEIATEFHESLKDLSEKGLLVEEDLRSCEYYLKKIAELANLNLETDDIEEEEDF